MWNLPWNARKASTGNIVLTCTFTDDDTGPVTYKAFRSTSRAFERFKSSGIIPMQVPPGTYWVSAFYDPGEVDKREWKTLGRIEVPEKLSDQLIEIKTGQ